MDLGLAGKRAIITGGSKGIGRAIADTFADEGCHVAICARGADGVAAAVEALKGKGVKAFGRALDVTDRDALVGWVAASAKELGGIDVVVANVSALDMNRTDEAFQREFEIDLLHTVRTVEAALPHLERSDAGAIVVISSVSGLEFDYTSPAYGTFKGALVHYASRLASELAGKR
ncbi:MAG: SDR family NAD(P)-dependent oxidoreductase, partial [Geminicoccales bacterium]